MNRFSLAVMTALTLAAGIPATAALTDPLQMPENPFRSPSRPRGSLYAVVPNHSESASRDRAYYGSLDPLTGQLTPIYYNSLFTNGDEYYVQTAAVRDNILYIPEFYYDEEGMVTNEYTVRWKRFDLLHGRAMEPLIFGTGQSALNMYFYSMTYDPAADRFYGLSLDLQTGSGGNVIMVDCTEEKWSPTYLSNVGGSVGNFMSNIVFNPADGYLYGLKDNGRFYQVDTRSGNAYEVMQFDDINEYYAFPMPMTSVPICYSPYDKSFIYVFADEQSQSFRLISIDAETYETFELSELYPLGYATTFYCSDQYAPDDAPDRVEITSVSFVGDSLSGTYDLQIPSTSFDGTPLDHNVTLTMLIDGETISTESVKPGAILSGTLNVKQGLHTYTVYLTDGNLEGPRTSREFYAGYDVPKAPTGLALAGGVLTWEAVPDKGIYNGNIDLNDLTYDVYLNGAKYNEAPVKGTSCPLTVTEKLQQRSVITVTATSHSTTSDHSQQFTRVIGRGDDLPVSYTPTAGDADIFETFNANDDEYEFGFMDYLGTPVFRIYTNNYLKAPDDWLFLPPLYFDSAADLYNLAFTYRNSSGNKLHNDNLDVFIGRDPLPEAMTVPIYSHEKRCQTESVVVEGNFVVPEAGTYYIGFHSRPGETTTYRGVHLSEFKVSKTAGSAKAPADPEITDVRGGAAGDFCINVDAVLPTRSLNGNALPANTQVTLIGTCGKYEEKVVGTPGQSVSLTVPVDDNGRYVVYLSASTADGTGRTLARGVYAGVDTPLPPANVKGIVTDDNLGVLLSWDPVGEVGANGGYVDVETVKYDIYSHSTTGSVRVAEGTRETQYAYHLPSATLQTDVNVGPVAVNESGTSVNGTYFRDQLGTPYPIPMQEEWGMQKFDCQKWITNFDAPYAEVEWLHATSSTVGEIGSPLFAVGGGLKAGTQSEQPVWGELLAPKASTALVDAAQVVVRYWDYPGAGVMEMWGRSASSQEPRLLDRLEPEGKAAEWKDWVVQLPDDFMGQGWVQCNIRCRIDATQFCLIDNYRVLQDLADDLAVNSIEVPYSTIIGEEPTFGVTVANAGSTATSGTLHMELLADGVVIREVDTQVPYLAAGDTYEHFEGLYMPECYYQYSRLEFRAVAKATSDKNPNNDEASAEFLLYDNVVPTVHDLAARRSGDGVDLQWSAPISKPGPESFEALAAFTISDRIGVWQNIDLDGESPFSIDGNRWPNDDSPCAWQVFDALEMGTMYDARLCPRSGSRMLMARSCQYADDEKPKQNSDWLISPEVLGGSRVGFWMNCLSSTFPETVQLWYSATGTKLDLENATKDANGNIIVCGDFKKVRNFTKSGDETWEYCSADLPADARYFALVYASYGDFGATIDDIEYSPAQQPERVVDSYDVFYQPDGGSIRLVDSGAKGTDHTVANAPGTAGHYYLMANVEDSGQYFSGALSNPAHVEASGVEGIDADGAIFIGAGRGRVLIGGAAGQPYTLSDVEGRVLSTGRVATDRFGLDAPAGIVVLTVGTRTAKLHVR